MLPRNLTNLPSRCSPWRFVLQTPYLGGPFCSIAMGRTGSTTVGWTVRGIYVYNDDSLDPLRASGAELSQTAWISTGFQVFSLPEKFLAAHSNIMTQKLAGIVGQVNMVEDKIANHGRRPCDFSEISHQLHLCNTRLIDIERRSRFEQNVCDAIEVIVRESNVGHNSWPSIEPQRTAISSRSFDFESLPRRIENARATINTLVQQRNEQLNIELSHSSRRIAEATLSDAKSMKTIAVLTMVFLPGTAVASFFSMTMFNWNSSGDSNLASKWLWVYFVVTVPLTALVLAAWWAWGHRKDRKDRHGMTFVDTTDGTEMAYLDIEPVPRQAEPSEEIEMQVTASNSKATG
jgi:hypothetical protein